MDEDLSAQIKATWRQLVAAYNWSLPELNTPDIQALAEQWKQDGKNTDRVVQYYSQRLYDAIVIGRMSVRNDAALRTANLASQDIWRIALHIAHKHVRGQEAEDLAQTVVERLITNPHKVEKPGSLRAWIAWQIWDLRKKVYKRRKQEESLDAQSAATNESAALASKDHEALRSGSDDTALHVIEQEHTAHILRLLKQELSEFHYRIIDLIMFQGFTPRDAAAFLGEKVTRIRVEKSRALNSIRNNNLLNPFFDMD